MRDERRASRLSLLSGVRLVWGVLVKDYDDGNNVLVRFNHAKYESDNAHWLALTIDDEEGVWLPKSQMAHIDFSTSEVWIPLWLAKKKELEYE